MISWGKQYTMLPLQLWHDMRALRMENSVLSSLSTLACGRSAVMAVCRTFLVLVPSIATQSIPQIYRQVPP